MTTIAVLGPGGVGGLLAGLLARAGKPVVVVAREQTAETIGEGGLRVRSVSLGEFEVHPRAVPSLTEPAQVLIVATKADGLREGLARIETTPELVVPLLNGLDHLALLRSRFGSEVVVAATIRVESDRPRTGLVMHTSPLTKVELASAAASALEPMRRLAALLSDAGIEARVLEPISRAAEAQVMWSKLVRLNALACMTSAYDLAIGEIRADGRLRGELVGAIEEGCAVADAEGARIAPESTVAELDGVHASLGSSMRRDIAAGRPPELDAIAGAVLRAGARHGIACPTIEDLAGRVAARAGDRSTASRGGPVHPAKWISDEIST